MASACICCGKKIGVLTCFNQLSDTYNEPICDKCFYMFNEKLKVLKKSEDEQRKLENSNELISHIKKCNFSREGTQYLIEFVDSLKTETEENLCDQELQLRIEEGFATHLLTTGYNFEGYKIISYKGVISGSVVLGTGVFSELEASINDLFGSESVAFSDKLEKAKKMATNQLITESIKLDGNAIIGIDFDYVTFSSNMIGVVANGTSVTIKKDN